MPDNNNEGGDTPVSEEEEALNILKEEGETIADDETVAEIEEDAPEESDEDTDDPEEEETEEESEEESDEEESDDDEDEEESDDEPEKTSRSPKMVPKWKMNVALKQLEKDLREELKGDKKPENEASDTSKQDIIGKIKKIADDYGTDENFVKELVDLVGNSESVPTDVVERLKKLELEKEDAKQESEFAREFEDSVLPLVKASNPDITDSALKSVKKQLHDLAFTEEYASLNLVKVYKAESDSIKISVPKKKKSMASSKTGKTRASTKKDNDDLTEDDLDGMSAKEITAFQKSKTKGRWS